MARHDREDDSAVIDAALRVMLISYSIERMVKGLRDSAAIVLRRVKHNGPTSSSVSGMPCAAEFCFHDEHMTQPAEPVDSSAAIPLEEIERIERGGE